jgi:hypothetical protein
MKAEVKWTSLPNNLNREGERVRLSVFVTPELKATTTGEGNTYVPLTGTLFEDWPAVVCQQATGGLTACREIVFTVHFANEAGQEVYSIQANSVQHRPDSKLWKTLIGHTKAYLDPLGQPGQITPQTHSYSVKDAVKTLKNVYGGAAERAFLTFTETKNQLRTTAAAPPLTVDPPNVDYLKSLESFGKILAPPAEVCDPTDECAGQQATPEMELFSRIENFHQPPAENPNKARNNENRNSLRAENNPQGANEFHQRVSQLGEYPDLLRKLGLIFDLEVGWNAAIPSVGLVWVTAASSQPLPESVITRTIYEMKRATRRFTPVSCNERPQLSDGMLRLDDTCTDDLNNTCKYTVVQMDEAGAALKALDFTRNVFRVSVSTAQDKPREMPPPYIRGAGISVAKANRAAEVVQLLAQPLAICRQQNTGSGIRLNAEHLTRGYRIDVWTRVKNTDCWRTLCARQLRFVIPNTQLPPINDEGWISLGIADRGEINGAQQLYIHESLFIWNGWSLVAPRPEKSVNEEGKPIDIDQTGYEDSNLKVFITPRPGSLPTLRFGGKYRLRARAVDLAGNDLAPPLLAPNDFTSATPEFIYRRFEPVNSPVVIPREDLKNSLGERVDHLVIRSNYNRPIERPAERHILPPKTSQFMAETHGMFDDSNGKPRKSSYQLIVERDKSISEIVPEEEFTLPYLPEPLSKGAAFHGLSRDGEAVCTVTFDGIWPDKRPFRILIEEGDALPDCISQTRVLRVQLKKAQILKVRLSSHLDLNNHLNDLNLFGIWSWIKEANQTASEQDAALGRVWALTPTRELLLIHAVQQPLREPVFSSSPAEPQLAIIDRKIGNTYADLGGEIHFDAHSSGKIDLIGEWSEIIDDVLRPKPEIRRGNSQVFEQNIDYDEANLIRFGASEGARLARHQFQDTKYRLVTYKSVATTRFLEQFFTPEQIQTGQFPPDRPPTRETPQSVRPVKQILNTARPDAPKVLYALPLFGWTGIEKTKDDKTKKEIIRRERKGGGLRIYLERPWYSSGDGELLGVVLWPGASAHMRAGVFQQAAAIVRLSSIPTELPNEIKPYVSQWGIDPIWKSNPLQGQLTPDHFLNADTVERQSPAERPQYTLEELMPATAGESYPSQNLMWVAAFKPQYDENRRLWYCDIEMDTQEAYFPFVRLALIRFQPNSVIEKDNQNRLIRDCHLSRVVLADFVQLSPGRTATITFDRKNARSLRISVQGQSYKASGLGQGTSVVEVTLEERSKEASSGWVLMPGKVFELVPQVAGDTGQTVWTGEIILDKELKHGKYRLVIREFETFQADRQQDGRRLVYADALEI